MCFAFAACFEFGKTAFAGGDAMRLFDPVFHEHGLQRLHGRPFDAHCRVAPVIFVLAIAQPLIGNAMSERVPDGAVEDQQFAVSAVIEAPQVQPAGAAVARQLHAVVGQALELFAVRARGAHGIDQHADLEPFASFADQQIDETSFEYAGGPDEAFQVHRVPCGLDVPLHHRVQGAVLQDCHIIPAIHRAAGQAGECLQALLDVGQRVQVQLEIRRVTPMRENEIDGGAECTGAEQQEGVQHAGGRSFILTPRRMRRCSLYV